MLVWVRVVRKVGDRWSRFIARNTVGEQTTRSKLPTYRL